MTKPLDSPLQSLEKGGFPFQTAIRQIIRRSPGCSVLRSEYAWRDSEHSDNFLDIVARKNRFVIPIECKKTIKETFIFLRPLGEPTTTDHIKDFRGVETNYTPTTGYPDIKHSFETWQILPMSPSCEFCVVGNSNERDQRLLEKDASKLVRATDALSGDRLELSKLYENISTGVLVPVIVTNAKIYTALYDPPNISLETAKFTSPPQIVPDRWVRFTKSFTAEHGNDFGNRSVFVVNSTSFQEFLGALEFSRY
jgi:hypothetical protein